MQINRLFGIVHILVSDKRTTANALAAHFEVSKRTILRDIDALAAAGIPLYTTQGKGGGVFIHEDFVLDKALVSDAERAQILFSLQGMAATGLVDTGQVLRRLRGFFTGADKEWISVDFARWGHSAADNEKFERLKDAVINEHTVAFDYLSPYGEQHLREVHPLCLSFKSKAWYLQAYNAADGEYRVFKFARINNLAATGASFCGSSYVVPPMQSVEEPAPQDFIYVTCLIAQNAKYRIFDEFQTGDVTVNADGTCTLRMGRGWWIYDYFLSFGAALEVLAPPDIRSAMIKRIDAVRQKYSDRT